MKHTKEPWVTHYNRIFGQTRMEDKTLEETKEIGRVYLNTTNGKGKQIKQKEWEANAERIVKCVNALEGMADPAEVMQAFLAFLDYAYSNPAPNEGGDLELWEIEQRALRAIKGR